MFLKNLKSTITCFTLEQVFLQFYKMLIVLYVFVSKYNQVYKYYPQVQKQIKNRI